MEVIYQGSPRSTEEHGSADSGDRRWCDPNGFAANMWHFFTSSHVVIRTMVVIAAHFKLKNLQEIDNALMKAMPAACFSGILIILQ